MVLSATLNIVKLTNNFTGRSVATKSCKWAVKRPSLLCLKLLSYLSSLCITINEFVNEFYLRNLALAVGVVCFEFKWMYWLGFTWPELNQKSATLSVKLVVTNKWTNLKLKYILALPISWLSCYRSSLSILPKTKSFC